MNRLTAILLIVLLTLGIVPLAGCNRESNIPLDPKDPVTITLWHYYNGAQQVAFNSLVDEFNETTGHEKGIVVEAINHGSIPSLFENLTASANHDAGASEMPDIFAAYADTVYRLNKKGLVANIEPYFSKEEQAQYVDAYIDEGRIGKELNLKIFPIAKSTEVMMINKTDWDKFSQATGTSMDALKTIEGVTETAQAYYEWTDSLTPVPNDGKAFFGRDSMANYCIIGCKQLGQELFEVRDGKVTIHCDKKIIRKLWDQFYVPYIKGYFAAHGKFRSDDAKMGKIIALVCSSSAATYFPKRVVVNDTESYPIEILILPAPCFQDGKPWAVQQGAGMAVTKSNPKQEYASVEFLKWFTDKERNIQFAVESGYLPVKKSANSINELVTAFEKIPESTERNALSATLTVAADTVSNTPLYTNQAFDYGTEARFVLETALMDKANQDLEAINQKVQDGMNRKAAIALFDTDENFENWFLSFRKQLFDTVH